jgi:hypothetical protein
MWTNFISRKSSIGKASCCPKQRAVMCLGCTLHTDAPQRPEQGGEGMVTPKMPSPQQPLQPVFPNPFTAHSSPDTHLPLNDPSLELVYGKLEDPQSAPSTVWLILGRRIDRQPHQLARPMIKRGQDIPNQQRLQIDSLTSWLVQRSKEVRTY